MLDFKTWLEMLKEPLLAYKPDQHLAWGDTWRDPQGLAKRRAKLPRWRRQEQRNPDERNKGYNQ